MANTLTVSQSQAIFGLCIPLAVLVGYMLARPLESTSLAVLVFILTAISCPLLLRWYHPALLIFWNAAVAPFFLPGRPYLWMVIAVVGLLVALVNRAVDPEKKFPPSGGVSWALVYLTLVLVGTALATGGMGTRTFGSEYYGGRKYFYIIAAIAGYFALVSRRIPVNQAKVWTTLFFLSGITTVFGNLAYMSGPKAYFLFDLFPPDVAVPQAIATELPYGAVPRIAGTMGAATAVACWLLAVYGLRGILDVTKPWRALLFLGAIPAGMLSGFRSFVVYLGLVVLIQFFLEGLHRTRWLLIGLALCAIAAGPLLSSTHKLPLPVQRALSFLPIEIDPVVRSDVEHSTQWRVEIWRTLLPEVPKYLLKGRGYAINPTDLYLTNEGVRRGLLPPTEAAILTTDYHNGPLSVLIPFGLWGALGLVWLLIAGGRVLYLNYRFGDPELRNINTGLFAFFSAQVLFFLLFFGAIESDMYNFTGLLGLSVCLNGGVCAKTHPEKQAANAENQVAPQTA